MLKSWSFPCLELLTILEANTEAGLHVPKSKVVSLVKYIFWRSGFRRSLMDSWFSCLELIEIMHWSFLTSGGSYAESVPLLVLFAVILSTGSFVIPNGNPSNWRHSYRNVVFMAYIIQVSLLKFWKRSGILETLEMKTLWRGYDGFFVFQPKLLSETTINYLH